MARKTQVVVALVVVAAVAAACGGGVRTTRRSTSGRSGPPAGPADIPAMRALLARYSPSGDYVVTTHERLPRTFVIGDTTTTLSHSKGFADFFDDASPDELVGYMDTAVHEVFHAYTSVMGHQLLVDTGTPLGRGAEAAYVGDAPILVPFTPTMPAGDMDATYPADAKTSRYGTYVRPSEPDHATQQDGVYGLLNEWNAYYLGARTRVDMWPWVRDEAPASEQLLVNYTARFHEMWVPYAEFKLFILHYLWHAKTQRPEVYRGLLQNQGFRRAFGAVDAAYAALLSEAAQLEPTVHAFARSRGLDADLRGGQLTYDGAPFTIRDDAYPAVLRHLASPRYQEILAELR